MSDAVEELIEHLKPRRMSEMLKRVHRFHQTNPQVLDFLIQELRDVRANGWERTSVGSLWHYARWVLTQKHRAPGESFVMSNNLFPHYERLIVILHPDLNGFFAMAKSAADEDFGTKLEATEQRGQVRKLVWLDGTPIEQGWRPSIPHEPKPVSRRDRIARKPPLSTHAMRAPKQRGRK